jgi:hypothetical protein
VLVNILRTNFDYDAADPTKCAVSAVRLGDESRTRLILPARRADIGGTHPVELVDIPDNLPLLVPKTSGSQRRSDISRGFTTEMI